MMLHRDSGDTCVYIVLTCFSYITWREYHLLQRGFPNHSLRVRTEKVRAECVTQFPMMRSAADLLSSCSEPYLDHCGSKMPSRVLKTTESNAHIFLSDQLAVTFNQDQRIRVYDAVAGTLLHVLQEEQNLNLAHEYTCMQVGSRPLQKQKKDGTTRRREYLIAMGTKAGQIVVWSTVTGKVLHRLGQSSNSKGHTSEVLAVSFCQSGTKLFSSGADKRIYQWNLQSGKGSL